MSLSVDPIIEVPIRGRKARYTLRVYDLAEAIAPVAHVKASGGVLQFGKRSRGYGQLVRRSFADITLRYVPQRIKEAFTGPFEETRFPATITGPDVDWRGIVKRGRRKTPVDESQGPDQISLTIYDGLKRLENLGPADTVTTIPGSNPDPDLSDYSLYDQPITSLLREIFAPVQQSSSYGGAIPVDLRWSQEMVGQQGDSLLPSTYDLVAPSIEERLMEGKNTRMDQLVVILEELGSICYMGLNGRIGIVPREELGKGGASIDVVQTEVQGSLVTGQIEGTTEEAIRPRSGDDDEWETTQKSGAVALKFGDDYNLLLDPEFQDVEIGSGPKDGYSYKRPLWWDIVSEKDNVVAAYTPDVESNAIMLGIEGWQGEGLVQDNGVADTIDADGPGEIARDVMRVTPKTSGLKAALFFRAESPGYMGSGSHTFTISHGANSTSDSESGDYPHNGINNGYQDPLTVPLDSNGGTISVSLQGDNVQVRDIKVQILVNNGLALSRLIVGDKDADAIEVEAPETWFTARPRHASGGLFGVYFQNYTLIDHAFWQGEKYYHPATLAAARRLAQQELGTENIETRVEGAIGPGTRLQWPSGRETVPVGRKIDLVAGRTEITDITIPSDL